MSFDIYKNVYYSETTQKVWRTDTTIGVPYQFEYIGKMNSAEYDLLLDVLLHVFGEEDINLKEFERYFGDIRTFCDKLKKLVDDL